MNAVDKFYDFNEEVATEMCIALCFYESHLTEHLRSYSSVTFSFVAGFLCLVQQDPSREGYIYV